MIRPVLVKIWSTRETGGVFTWLFFFLFLIIFSSNTDPLIRSIQSRFSFLRPNFIPSLDQCVIVVLAQKVTLFYFICMLDLAFFFFFFFLLKETRTIVFPPSSTLKHRSPNEYHFSYFQMFSIILKYFWQNEQSILPYNLLSNNKSL